MKHKIIAILGPTSSGKTSLGIEIAKQVDGEIISVDSRQVYRGMDIVTGKEPGEWNEEDQSLMIDNVVHWGIDLVDPDEDFSVADFKLYAEQKIEEIVSRSHMPILVGGTGFWLQALIDNFDLTQTAQDAALRAKLEGQSVEELFDQYKALDPEGAEVIDAQNKRRLIRALEVTMVTGKPFSTQQSRGESKYEVLQIGIEVNRQVLFDRINRRVDKMMEQGLLEEVRVLHDRYGCEIPSMSGIGYRQFCRYLDGLQTIEESLEEMKRDSRHYAKRQVTWWKRDERIIWVRRSEETKEIIKKFL